MTAHEHGSEQITGEATIMSELDALRRRAMDPGTLPREVKELIALAVAVRGGNDTSIAYHVHNAMESGCAREEIAEAVDVAVMVAGEATAVHAVQVQKALADGMDATDDAGEHSFRRFAEDFRR
jgi:AhpD family alkylhydroperoxidase